MDTIRTEDILIVGEMNFPLYFKRKATLIFLGNRLMDTWYSDRMRIIKESEYLELKERDDVWTLLPSESW